MSSDNNIRSLLNRGETLLAERGVPNARRNVEWILCDALACSVLDLYTAKGPPAAEDVERFWERIHRRAEREPLQYILGNTEFMSLQFEVHPGVFVPRPDTEVLVEKAERWLRARPLDEPLRVLDLCCGSGVIGVSLAARIPNLQAWAVDRNIQAIAATMANARLNDVDDRLRVARDEAAGFLEGVAGGTPERFTAITCNPPYIESDEIDRLPDEVRNHEPIAALDGGADGLALYRELIPRLSERLIPGGLAIFEIGDAQAEAVSVMLVEEKFEGVETIQDFAGHDRAVAAFRPGGREA
jgi:release factor glutamine methyltransferase